MSENEIRALAERIYLANVAKVGVRLSSYHEEITTAIEAAQAFARAFDAAEARKKRKGSE